MTDTRNTSVYGQQFYPHQSSHPLGLRSSCYPALHKALRFFADFDLPTVGYNHGQYKYVSASPTGYLRPFMATAKIGKGR